MAYLEEIGDALSLDVLQCYAVAFTVVGALDLLVAQRCKARWFALHALANAIIASTSAPGVIASLADPHNSGNGDVYPESSSPFAPASRWPIAFLNVVHLYHCLFFKLTPSDIFHHGLFVGGVGIPAQLFRWGSMRSFMSFFASGLPGGIDCAPAPAQLRPRNSVCAMPLRRAAPPHRADAMLALVKQGKVEKMTQRRVCASLNQWCRGPGLVISSFLIYSAVMSGRGTFPAPFGFWTASLMMYNSLLYTGSSIRAHEKAVTLAIATGDSAAGGTKTNAYPVSAEKLRQE